MKLTRSAAIEFLSVVLLVGGFTAFAAQKIGFHPPPWKDEPWLMQPAYEVLRQGRMCLPMFRHMGAELDKMVMTDPVFTYMLAGWFRIFGFGVTQARLFNLALSAAVLALVYLIARRLGGRWAGFIAVALLIFDNNYFTNSRFLRNDFASIFFALSAALFYLHRQRSRWLLAAAGLCAALSALSHLNGLYSIVLLGIWLLIEHGVRAPLKREPWIAAAGVLIAALPYGAYCFHHKETYIAQWGLFSKGRASGATFAGLVKNAANEPKRYADWDYGIMTETKNRAVRFFQAFTAIALLYLLGSVVRSLWKREWSDGKDRLFLLSAAIWCAVFFAAETTNKTHSYLPHLTTWFAICVGVAGSDLISKLKEWRCSSVPKIRTASWVMVCALAAVALVYLYGAILLFGKYDKYLKNLDPNELAKTESAIKETAESNLVPVGSTRHWYLFAERDDYRAFSRPLSKRILKGDFEGEQYALVVNERERKKFLGVAGNIESPVRQFNLIAELPNSPYGPLWIYYVGTDQSYLSRSARKF